MLNECSASRRHQVVPNLQEASLPNERWADVVGYEGLYMVSDMGRVLSMPKKCRSRGVGRLHARPAKMLACPIDVAGAGYRFVGLSRDSRVKKQNVHVLVLEAFVGPRPGRNYDACHEDGDRTNAKLSNLRWDTKKGNQADALRHGTRLFGERAPKAKISEDLARWIRESPQSSLQLAPILGVASSTIRAIRIGQNWRNVFKEAA